MSQHSKTPRGVSMAEYALLGAFIGIFGIGALMFLGDGIALAWPDLENNIFMGGGGPLDLTGS